MTERWYADTVSERLQRIEERIREACLRSGRKREEVTLMAVTKTIEEGPIREAIAAGIRHIGENRVQEWQQKRPIWEETGVQTHLIGHLQSNKVRQVVGRVHRIESVDRMHLAQAVDRVAAERGVVVSVLCEVNIGGEESKSGVSPSQAEELLAQMSELSHIHVEGLMTVPPIAETERERRYYFEQMYKLFLDIKSKMLDNIDMSILSMGMSSDFEEAILEGSTQVRIGTALFGARNYANHQI